MNEYKGIDELNTVQKSSGNMPGEISYQETCVTRVLNPTSIDLGEFVINPYMGCAFNCLYCYVRSNRSVIRRNVAWGKFVDIRKNTPEQLDKELSIKKPHTVLLGSTTECFQPIEMKYALTRQLLEVLNRHGVYYIILTRSPLIVSVLPLLKSGYCKRIYFTINNYPAVFKSRLEPGSPAFSDREEAIHVLQEAGLAVTPYFSPVLPGISDLQDLFGKYQPNSGLEFECLNFRLANIEAIIDAIGQVDTCLQERYKRMLTDEAYYNSVWENIRQTIAYLAREDIHDRGGLPHNYRIHVHQFGDYFSNTYNNY